MPRSKRQVHGEEPPSPRKKRNKVAVVGTTRMTRSASRNTTMAAVFSTTELLENTLKFLPMQDLLLAQRVSREWKSVIEQSISLQQMLFFTPKQADFCWEHEHTEYRTWPRKVSRNHVLPTTAPKGSRQFTFLRNGQMNPLLFNQIDIDVLTSADGGGETIVHPSPHLRHPSVKFQEASWRRMLISQPPVKSCELEWWGTMNTLGFPDFCRHVTGLIDLDHYITCQDTLEAAGMVPGTRRIWWIFWPNRSSTAGITHDQWRMAATSQRPLPRRCKTRNGLGLATRPHQIGNGLYPV